MRLIWLSISDIQMDCLVYIEKGSVKWFLKILDDIEYEEKRLNLENLMDLDTESIDIMDYFYKMVRQKVCDLKDAASEHFKELDEILY